MFACGWTSSQNIVRPNTSNMLGIIQAIGIDERVETKSLSPSPTVNQSEKFRDSNDN